MSDQVRINEQITSKELRVIDHEGNNLGVINSDKARSLAEDAGLDLIEISPTATPPVAKIMDYGKYQYLEQQKKKKAKLGSTATETKSIQVKIGTGDHDLAMKAGRAGKFLKEGHRVKIELFLPGRSKYFDKNFLQDRLERLLNLIPEEYRIAEEPKKNPKGLYVIIEKETKKKKNENQ